MRRYWTGLAIIVGLLAALSLTIAVGVWRTSSATQTESAEVWTCSMHPQVRLPRPGQCPICGMNLIPAAQLKSQQDQQARQAGLQTVEVQYRRLVKDIRAVGKLDFDESRVEYITARVAGRADRLFVDFVGVEVKKGDHLVELYSPNLIVAQRELLLAAEAAERMQSASRPMDDRFIQANLKAARDKLLLLGILPEQVEQIERTKQVQTHLTIYSPLAGTVIEKQVRVGQYVEEGDLLYRIAELDPIWLYLDIYEYDIGWIEYGQKVEVTVEAFPGEVFHGVVTFVDPFLDDKTRAVKVRVNLKNADRRLKPAMYASAVIRVPLQSDGTPQPTGYAGKFSCPMHPELIRDEAGNCPICQMQLQRVQSQRRSLVASHPQPASSDMVLAVPVSAVLDTGLRQVAYRLNKDGAYELVELKMGPRTTAADDPQRDFFPVFEGLAPGDQVVIRGGFMLDSQRQIEGMPSLLYPQGQSAASLHAGHGAPVQPSAPAGTAGHKH